MAKLPESAVTLPTVLAIYDRYTRTRGEWRREHLGASQIGKECDRALWYQFRWCTEPSFEGRMLRLFDTGQREEARLVADLRAVGIEVHEFEQGTRKQFQVSDVGGHFGGSLDGAARGFKESAAWHVLEFKTANAKSFAKLKKEGVEKAKPEHFAQMQCYMHLTGMERAYYLCVCKDTDEIHGERIRYHAPTAWRLIERARRIINASEPPPRISEDPDHFRCNWCEHKPICHERKVPEVNCRTCVHATPELDGDRRWRCAKWRQDISVERQHEGCEMHVFIPALIPLEALGGFKNGGAGGLTSADLREVLNAGV